MSNLYDRRYEVIVTFFSGQSIRVDGMRCTFNFEKTIGQTMQFGEVTIWNLTPTTETDIFNNAKMVTVQAGYVGGAFGVIFQGSVRQPIRGKQDGVDTFITLGLLDGDDSLNLAFCSFYMGAGNLPRNIARQVVQASNVPFELEFKGDWSGGEATERGKTVFGQPGNLLQSLAINNNAAFYSNNNTAVLSKLSQRPPAIVPELNYQTGLIGVPTQQNDGLAARTLINPSITIDTWVKLNNRNIIQALVPFQAVLNPTVIDLDGLYRVVGIKATGDTRGNDWYYDLELVSQNGRIPALAAIEGQYGY